MKFEVRILTWTALAGAVACSSESDPGSEAEAEAEAESEAEAEAEGEANCEARKSGANVACIGDNPIVPVEGDSITVRGRIVEAIDRNVGIAGVTVEVLDPDGNVLYGPFKTDEEGRYSVVIEGADGFLGSMRMTMANYWTSEIFAHTRPLTQDLCQDVVMLSDSIVKLQAQIIGNELGTKIEIDSTKAIVVATVVDCDDLFLAGAKVDVDSKYDPRMYLNEAGLPDGDLEATTTTGSAIFANVAVGAGSVGAERGEAAVGVAAFRASPKTAALVVVQPQ